MQLTLGQTRRLADRPGVALLDSCANEDHPMIGRVWGDGLVFDDWALGLAPGSGAALRFWLGVERACTKPREALKRVINSALGRKRA